MTLIERDLYEECLCHHQEVRDLNFVVKRSLPIPYFGDLAAYAESPLKVVTAALNPSGKEFPEDGSRFDVVKGLKGADELEAELSNYFSFNPYRAWFRSFEPVLNGLGASYGGAMAEQKFPHTALHLDMCSPIATSPTWSKLTLGERAKLTSTGRQTFERLIDALRPDIVISSLGWSHIEGWHSDFSAGRGWEPILTYTTSFSGAQLKTPLRVQVGSLKSHSGHAYLFVNGSAANTPFGRFHGDRKREVGSALLGHFGKR